MEEYIRIIEDLICEFHQSGEKERYEQAKALEILLSLLGEIDDKEASDALHMLLHCALANKDFETQKQQFQIVNAYIKQLEEENKQLKEYIVKAPNLDEMTAVQYTKIQEEAYIMGRAKEQQRAKEIIHNDYIPKSKVKEKIEEIKRI